MDKFIVSARKYRPQTFDTVVGQPHITTTLKNAIRQNQLAHAFLFCGPRGVGKTTCARILAKTINCENPTPEGEACNKCNSCISFNEGGSLNYFELDAASNNSVEDIRELVTQVRFVPQSGRYKVYVIDEVHMLSSAAFNAFLKTLEEPPSYAIFILATTEKHKIIPTILSRCQIFDFKRITVQDTVEHLQEICSKENLNADLPSLQVIAQKSEGCMRDALSLLDKIASFTNGELTYSATLEHLNILDADFYFRLLENMQQQDLAGAMMLYDEINAKGFEGDSVVNGFAEFIRNLLVCKDPKAAGLLEVVDNFRDKYITVAKQAPSSLLISALNILSEAEIGYRAARNKRLHVELALIKLCYLQQALELSLEKNELSKKKVVDTARPVAFRQIRPIEIRKQLKETSSSTKPKTIREEKPAKLMIESTVELVNESNEKALSFASQVKERKDDRVQAGKLSALGKIREQYQGVAGNGKTNLSDALEIDRLQKAWNAFVVILKESRNPAAQSFELARLRIKGLNTFEVVTSNNLEQKFIEKDRNRVFSHLQKELNNQLLQFSVVIEGRAGDKPNPELSLTAREQYQKMIEEFPLVKELKERLRLELDY